MSFNVEHESPGETSRTMSVLFGPVGVHDQDGLPEPRLALIQSWT